MIRSRLTLLISCLFVFFLLLVPMPARTAKDQGANITRAQANSNEPSFDETDSVAQVHRPQRPIRVATVIRDSVLELQVQSPPFNPVFRTTGEAVELTGTARGPNPITQVRWSNSHGETGIAEGVSVWHSGRIPLEPGNNELAVTVTDAYNYSATTVMIVERLANSGEYAFSDDVRSSFYRGKPVTYSVVDGVAIFEGDIVLGTVEELESARKAPRKKAKIVPEAGGIYQNKYLWPGGIIPYTIGFTLFSTDDVRTAVSYWNNFSSYTGVTLVPRTNQSNYVNFNHSLSVCNSNVGTILSGGAQTINYGLCGWGGVAHEIGHAIGLWHEQSRRDRDAWVTINWGNIQLGQEYNFNQYGIQGIDIGTYDYDSIMHYGSTDFSVNGQPTIVPKTSGVTIGQRDHLSSRDLNGVRFLYQCLASGAQVGENTDGIDDQQIFVNAYARNGDKPQVGCPIDTVHRWYNGRIQDFNGGAGAKGGLMKADSITDAFWIHGGIWNYYEQHGGPNDTFWDGSKLGYPIDDERRGYNSSASGAETSYSTCEKGGINFYGTGSRAGQAYVVRGAILTQWSHACSTLCYEGGPLGMPVGEELAAPQSPFGTTGRYQDFESGQIYWHATGPRQNNTYYVQFGIASKYKTLGSGSSLGFPISNEYTWQGKARSDFEGGYIYWDGSQAIVVLNQQNYSITVNASPSAGGTVSGGGTFPAGSSRTVTATANSGYTFANWTENGSVVSSSSGYTFTLNSNRNLVANFTTVPLLPPPTLVAPGTTTAPGSSVATVTPTFQWQPVNSADGYALYVSRFNGSTYDLIFNSESDVGQPLTGTSYVFPSGRLQDGNQYRWNMSTHNGAGYGAPNASRYYFYVSLPVQNYAITVSALPSAGGTVGGGGTFAAGSSRTVTATANGGYTFANWTENGSVVSSSASYTFTLNANRNLIANFTVNQVNYTITVSASPSAGGTVGGGGTFAVGGSRTVTATANNGYMFANWADNGSIVSSSASYTFTLNSNRTLVANFTVNTGEALLLSETFSGGIPGTWTVIDGGNGGGAASTWTTADPCNEVMSSPFSGPFAMVDSDCAGPGAIQDEQLVTPAINATGCGQVILEFSNQFFWYDQGLNEIADVDVSTNGGGTWVNVLRMQGGSDGYPAPNTKSVNITSVIGANRSNVRIRFHYYNANFEFWWAIDNVQVKCTNAAPKTPSDFDGDRKADITVYRPSNGYWFVINSTDNHITVQPWGLPGDIYVPADYDGDGKTDVAVYRPSDGNWFIINSSTGQVRIQQWGLPGDVPVPADFDGDGKADIAIFRPSDGAWWIINSSNGQVRYQQWALNGDKPVPADYDGDGKADIAVYRPSNGYWFIINSSDGHITVTPWGLPGDRAIPADYDGDGKTDVAVFRPSDGNWFIINSSTGQVTIRQWALSGDVPVPADYDGDGKADITVYRPSDGNWFIINSSNGQVRIQQWGLSGDLPVPAAYVR